MCLPFPVCFFTWNTGLPSYFASLLFFSSFLEPASLHSFIFSFFPCLPISRLPLRGFLQLQVESTFLLFFLLFFLHLSSYLGFTFGTSLPFLFPYFSLHWPVCLVFSSPCVSLYFQIELTCLLVFFLSFFLHLLSYLMFTFPCVLLRLPYSSTSLTFFFQSFLLSSLAFLTCLPFCVHLFTCKSSLSFYFSSFILSSFASFL